MTLTLVSSPEEQSGPLEPLLQSGYRYALSLTHDRSEAEDLLQEACVAVVRAAGKWEKAYLFATIRNRLIDGYRRKKKILFVPLDPSSADEAEPLMEWDVPDVLEKDKLGRALAKLRLEEREALFLAFVEGYTAEQIGRMTKRPRSTVLSLLHRGKHKLRQLLQGIERGEERP